MKFHLMKLERKQFSIIMWTYGINVGIGDERIGKQLRKRNMKVAENEEENLGDIQQCRSIAYYITAPLYNILIIFDTVVTQKQTFKHENDEFISVAILRLSQHHQSSCAARIHMSKVGNVNISRSTGSYYCYIHMPTFRIVWWLCNLSLGGKLCLCDDKKYCVCIYVRHPLPLQANIEKRHTSRAHKQEAVSDWLNPHSLGTIDLTRFNKIATQGAPQMAVDKEANSL